MDRRSGDRSRSFVTRADGRVAAVRRPTHAVIGLGVASPFAMPELPHATIAGGALLVAGVLAGTAPDVHLRLGLRHRGVTHSVWAAAVVSLPVLAVGELVMPNGAVWPLLTLVVALAWVSHALADLTNRTAVAVLWPRWWGPYRFGVREGSMVSLFEEWSVRVVVVAFVVAETSAVSGLGLGRRRGGHELVDSWLGHHQQLVDGESRRASRRRRPGTRRRVAP